MRRLAHDESGSILPLVAVYAAIALALVFVASAATSLYLDRARLQGLADGAALAAAESFDLSAASFDGRTVRPELDASAARDAAERYLAVADSDGVRLVAATAPDGRGARVVLQTRWRPALLSAFVPGGVTIRVEASARMVFW